MSESGGQRIDKWLWHARFARTRTAAQRLVEGGDVRVNREKVAASSRLVRPGDVLTLASARGVQVLIVTAIAPRRGSPEAARLLYREHEGSADRQGADRQSADHPAPASRPDRRERREIASLKRGPDE